MGYSTEFEGQFTLSRPLTAEHTEYIRMFSGTRRMKRSAELTEQRPDPVRTAVGLPVGVDGGYFVGAAGDFGQEQHPSILDWNRPPHGQPGLWCQWVPTKDLHGIEWNGVEKFYAYAEWLRYLLRHFLLPWGYELTGSVAWGGALADDCGTLSVVNGAVVAVSE